MSIKLIYHTPESATGGFSPFDKTISRIVRDENIRVACPYLSLDYFQRLLEISTSWRILTDVEEWLGSYNKNARQEIQNFIGRHNKYIHHLNNLHAKVIIAGNKALVGSANFTKKGLTERAEVSVLFEHEPQVEELARWFDALWRETAPPSVSELETCACSMPSKPIVNIEKPETYLTSPASPIRSKLTVPDHSRRKLVTVEHSKDLHKQLVERLRLSPNREWINNYLNLIKEVLDVTGFTNQDPRLVTSIPKSSPWFLPVSVNHRYVLAPCRRNNDFVVGIIYGPEFEHIPELQAKTVYYGRFNPLSGENKKDAPFFLRFKNPSVPLLSEDIRRGWIQSILIEKQRAKSSPYRKYHQPIVYEAAMNINYRSAVLSEAFPDEKSV